MLKKLPSDSHQHRSVGPYPLIQSLSPNKCSFLNSTVLFTCAEKAFLNHSVSHSWRLFYQMHAGNPQTTVMVLKQLTVQSQGWKMVSKTARSQFFFIVVIIFLFFKKKWSGKSVFIIMNAFCGLFVFVIAFWRKVEDFPMFADAKQKTCENIQSSFKKKINETVCGGWPWGWWRPVNFKKKN